MYQVDLKSMHIGGKIDLKNSGFCQVFKAHSGTFADPKKKAVKPGNNIYGRDFSAKRNTG